MATIDFFVHYERQEQTETPLEQELKRLGVDYRIFAQGIQVRYKRRHHLYFSTWPRLLLSSLRDGWKSLFSSERADVVVAYSHLILAPLVMLKCICFKKKPHFVLVGFIYTQRKSRLHNWLRFLYFRTLLSRVSLIICQTPLEVEHNERHFQFQKAIFAYVRFGMHVNRIPSRKVPEPYVFSAGRSGRDYDLLIRVFSRLPYNLHIACDSMKESGHMPNIRVLRDCFDSDFLDELAGSDLVVVPLIDNGFSAGQMVILEAMALGKPAVVTRTPTTEMYGEHMKTVYFVEPGDDDSMEKAVHKLLSDRELAARIGASASDFYVDLHSEAAYVRRLIECFQDKLSLDLR